MNVLNEEIFLKLLKQAEQEMAELRKVRDYNADYCDEVETNLGTNTKAHIDTLLEEMGWEDGELDLNGWENDYWQTWKKDNRKFNLTGSMYNGSSAIYLVEEKEEEEE